MTLLFLKFLEYILKALFKNEEVSLWRLEVLLVTLLLTSELPGPCKGTKICIKGFLHGDIIWCYYERAFLVICYKF